MKRKGGVVRIRKEEDGLIDKIGNRKEKVEKQKCEPNKWEEVRGRRQKEEEGKEGFGSKCDLEEENAIFGSMKIDLGYLKLKKAVPEVEKKKDENLKEEEEEHQVEKLSKG